MATKVQSVKNLKSTTKKVVKSAQGARNEGVEVTRDLWLVSLGAAARVRKQGEELVSNVLSFSKKLKKDARKMSTNLTSDVQEQANGLVAQVKGAAAANLGWVSEKVEGSMGKVLSKLGVPSKAEVQELSRKVSELQKQVKAIKKAA